MKIKTPSVPVKVKLNVKVKQPSTNLKLKFKRQVHYFFRGGWMGCVEEWRIKLSQLSSKLRLKLKLKLSLATRIPHQNQPEENILQVWNFG